MLFLEIKQNVSGLRDVLPWGSGQLSRDAVIMNTEYNKSIDLTCLNFGFLIMAFKIAKVVS